MNLPVVNSSEFSIGKEGEGGRWHFSLVLWLPPSPLSTARGTLDAPGQFSGLSLRFGSNQGAFADTSEGNDFLIAMAL